MRIYIVDEKCNNLIVVSNKSKFPDLRKEYCPCGHSFLQSLNR